jgi:L,D-transpeptidase YcbB
MIRIFLCIFLLSAFPAYAQTSPAPRVVEFYQTYQGLPFWVDTDRANKQAQDVITILEKSWEHGLNPQQYRVGELKSLAEQEVLADPQAFETLMTDSVVRYARDMTGMRVSPRVIEADPTSWSRGVKVADFLTSLSQQSNKVQLLEALPPRGELYAALQRELISLHDKVIKNPQADPQPIALIRTLREGQADDAIPLIRERLGVALPKDQDPKLYDTALGDAVAQFQEENGIKPDRLIGKRTMAAMNEGRADRLLRVIANMERLRWMDPNFNPARYIKVNVPAMRLWAIENGAVVADMPVVIGRETRPTYSFITEAVGVRFNPKWHVPDTIKEEDFLPLLQQDPLALEKKNIAVIQYTSDGAEEIDTTKVDWSKVTPKEIRNLGMVQGFGSDNALGRIRILMPNRHDIYLHDTNTPNLFEKDFRALSSGCIRMKEPDKIANFILSKNPDWDATKLQTLLDRERTSEIKAQEPVAVFILYQTLWMGAGGRLRSAPDIYGEDIRLIAALAAADSLPPEINTQVKNRNIKIKQ